MVLRKLNQLIKIAKEYNMPDLVRYYEMKIDFINTPYDTFLAKPKRKRRGYFVCYLVHRTDEQMKKKYKPKK